MLDDVRRVVGFNIDVQRLVVRLSVGVVGSVVKIKCNVEVVSDLEVSLDSNVQSVGLKMSSYVLSYSVSLRSRDVLEYC